MNYLDLTPGSAPLVVKVSEGDIGREISFTLVEDGLEYSIPTGAVITCEILKADGHGTTIPCTWSGSVVTMETTEQSTLVAGKATAELRIVNGADDIGTANFILAVEPRPINADTDQTDSSYSQTGEAGDVWTLGSNGVPSWSPSGLDASTATAGQVLTADGNGGHYWDRPTAVNVPVSGFYNDETEELVFENVNGTELFGVDVSEVGGSGDGLTSAQKSALIAVINAIGAFNVSNGQTLIDAFNSAWQETASIRLSPTSGTVTVGSTVNVSAITTGEGTLTATSSNPSVATVSVSGSTITVRGVASGTAVITASFGGASATYTATVSAQSIPATGITLNRDTISFNSAQTVILSATVTPSNTTDTVTWSTSDANVATVDGGAVVPVDNGSCTITARAGSVSATCAVTVNIESGEITMMPVVQHVSMGNIPLYSDDGSTAYSDARFPTTNGKGMRSERIFDSDTNLKITVSPSGNAFQCYLFTSSLWDGETVMYNNNTEPAYYHVLSSNGVFPYGWSTASHTFNYTVKAGFAFVILGISSSYFDNITVEVV